jgi:hypothetical protein
LITSGPGSDRSAICSWPVKQDSSTSGRVGAGGAGRVATPLQSANGDGVSSDRGAAVHPAATSATSGSAMAAKRHDGRTAAKRRDARTAAERRKGLTAHPVR